MDYFDEPANEDVSNYIFCDSRLGKVQARCYAREHLWGRILLMTIPRTRSRQRPDGSTSIEVELEFLFTSTMLVHIERLPHLHVVSKRSWALSDSFECCFCFQGHRFSMGIPFGNIIITSEQPDTPAELFEAIMTHVNEYKTVWPHQLIWASSDTSFYP